MSDLTTIAAFDFDETLTRRDTVVPFLRTIGGDRRLALGLLARSHRLAVAAARRDRDAIRSAATDAVLRGRHRDDLETTARLIGERIVEDWLRPDTAARLGWHREQGHRTVIVSASYELYVDIVARHLGADAVLATRLEFDAAGRCTGRLDGPNCRGPEKVRRLHRWLDEQAIARDDAVVWAYGDSRGDRELLADADHPVWVREPLASVDPST